MKGVIKGALYEELQNSLRMKKEYENAIKKLPSGCLSLKKIGKYEYCYIAKRIGKKVKFYYRGKLSDSEKKKYEEAKKLRKKYRHLLSRVNKQIKYLKGALRGKEPI